MSSSELFIRNPHSILAALTTRPHDVLEIHLPSKKVEGTEGDWSQVVELAKRNSIKTTSLKPNSDRKKSDSRNSKSVAGRGSAAGARIRPKEEARSLFETSDSSQSPIWIALDQIQDPQNLGAIFRIAAFFGVSGILLTKDRSASLTETAYDVASGGVEVVPFQSVANLHRALEDFREEEIWILGTSERGSTSLAEIKRDRPWLIVFGNEEKGIRSLTEKTCDQVCKIPSAATGVDSLNVSTSVAVMLTKLGFGS